MMTALSVLPLPPPTATPPVVIALFGSFNVTINGQAEVAFRSNKARALLAYLLVNHTHPVLRTTLSELLWPDYQAASARVNLRQTLANLRDSLAPYDLLYTDRNHVQLKIDPAIVRCDVVLFSELVDACKQHTHCTINQCPLCQERLQQAVTLSQGAFLENFPNVDSPAFHRWLQAQRTYFAERCAEAQALLSTERKPCGNLPPPLTPLIGRTQEIAELVPRLRHTIYRCVSLVGPGGIGKTRLACAVGEQLSVYFPDGIWLVALGALVPTTAAETPEQLHDRIATAIAVTIGCTLSGASHPAHQVTTYLADKTVLLILDSFEHLTVGAAWLPTVLAAAPQLRLLITTRHRLPLQSQIVYQVGGLAMPPEPSTTGAAAAHLLAQYASVQLFVERAESAQLSLPLSLSTLVAISRLCHFVDGSPWAIEVAVSMLDQHTPSTLLNAIQQNYRTLSTSLLDLPARQRSAEAVFLAAWALLTQHEAQILARCAVFRGGFMLDAAQTVAAATPAILATLVHKSLLQHRDEERYTMHDLVRQFAGEQLMQDAVMADRTHAAHAAYFTGLLATWQPDDATIHRFRTAVTQDWDNVQAAWAWAVETDAIPLLQQGLGGLAEFYNLMELFLEADATLGRTVERVRLLLAAANTAGTAAARCTLQTLLAHLLWRHCYFVNDALAEIARAAPLAQELLALAHELGDGVLAARGYYELGVIAHFQGESQREEQVLRQALSLAQQHGAIYDQMLCLNLLGLNYQCQGDATAALRYFQQALALTQHGSYAYYDLMVLNNIGSLLVETGHFSAALAHFQQSLPRAAAFNSKIAFIKASLGEIALLVGDYAAAQPQLTEARQHYADLHDHFIEPAILNMLAMLHGEQGDDIATHDYCQRALKSLGGHIYAVQQQALCLLGHLYRRQGNWDAAVDVYQQALTLSQESQQVTDELLCQTYLAAVTLGRGDATAALVAVEPLLATFATVPFSPQQRPQDLLLIAYQILVANAEPRAQAVLRQAWNYVQEQAAKIDDPRLRETFLTNVPANRELARLVGKGVRV